MHSARPLRSLAVCFGLAFLSVAPSFASAATLTAEEKAAHALNRLGYGPRPGEVAKVADLGVEKWIRAQLDPSTIPDPVAEAEVAKLEKLKLGTAYLLDAYQTEQRERRQLQQARANEDKDKAAELRMAMQDREQVVVAQALGELMHAKLVRAVYSEHQLEEALVDFWFNHFNVDARKQQIRAAVVGYEQDTIRPHVFGNFRDLLEATAKSPAMLVYLDNWRSSREMELGPGEQAAARRLMAAANNGEEPPAEAVPAKRGLNENYGRELLELHTLGVDAGYSQKDVQEAARAFTGWTIEPRTGEFVFRTRWHDTGEKKILGATIPAGGGLSDGEKVLDLLVAHPATAKRIAYKLCQRFVADEPPTRLVDRVARAFAESKGDLRKTYEALFFSPEFFSEETVGAKTKSPFEFTASALRATGATLIDAEDVGMMRQRQRQPLRAVEAGATLGRGGDRLSNLPRKTSMMHLIEMGQSLYAWGPPTGFPEDSSTWVSAGALVARLNYALALTGGQVADARVDARPLLGDANPDRPKEVVAALSRSVLGRLPGTTTSRVLLEQAAPATDGATAVPDVPKLLALLVGSPEFQRR